MLPAPVYPLVGMTPGLVLASASTSATVAFAGATFLVMAAGLVTAAWFAARNKAWKDERDAEHLRAERLQLELVQTKNERDLWKDRTDVTKFANHLGEILEQHSREHDEISRALRDASAEQSKAVTALTVAVEYLGRQLRLGDDVRSPA